MKLRHFWRSFFYALPEELNSYDKRTSFNNDFLFQN